MARTELIFSHPNKRVGGIRLFVKPDEITWSYGLNTQAFPTYGGEVIQILSCYIGDMQVKGTCRNYRELEKIYRWFIKYIQIATQKGEFDQRPVTMRYPHRGWTFRVYPKQLPGFKYGRDIVAPEWRMVAHVVEPDPSLKASIVTEVEEEAIREGGIRLFGKVTGNIGFIHDDPFSSPDGLKDNAGEHGKEKHPQRKSYNNDFEIGDWYNNLIPSYLEGNFDDLAADYSRPTGLGRLGRASLPQRNDGPGGNADG